MAAANPPRNSDDPRSRYTHQAYDVTYGGRPAERPGDASMGRAASATYQANFQLTVDVSDTAAQRFTLPPWVYCNKVVVAIPGAGALAACSIHIGDVGDFTGTKATLIAGLALDAASASDVDLTTNIEPKNIDQTIEVEVTTAGTGVATVLLKCDIVQTAWK